MSDISREDALAHFGVKGMRWGVRKDKRPSGAQIREARYQINARRQDIFDADRAVRRATTAAGKKKALDEVSKAGKAYYNDPALKVANLSTRGEQVAKSVLLASGAVLLVNMAANL